MDEMQKGTDKPVLDREALIGAITDVLWDFDGRGTFGNARDAAIAILVLLDPFLFDDGPKDMSGALERLIEGVDGFDAGQSRLARTCKLSLET